MDKGKPKFIIPNGPVRDSTGMLILYLPYGFFPSEDIIQDFKKFGIEIYTTNRDQPYPITYYKYPKEPEKG